MPTTLDKFLGGKVLLEQPKSGYRAGIDAVLLAAAATARPGQKILELGCGAGAAMFCLAARISGLKVTGIELQPDFTALAEANARRNQALSDFTIIQGDARRLPRSLPANSFDHVIANPPYHESGAHSPSPRPGKNIAHAMREADLAAWIKSAHGRLKHRGVLTMIHNISGLPSLLQALDKKFGAVTLLPLWPKTGQPAKRLLLRAVKDSRAPPVLLPGLILHDDEHEYYVNIRHILSNGANIHW